jgi:hypothetical protein
MGNRLSAADDAQRFRDEYPEQEVEEPEDANANVLFYQNRLSSQSHDPTQGTIDEIHATWWGCVEPTAYSVPGGS